MLLRVMQWISPLPGVSGFSFFHVFVCGLGLEEFSKSLGSVVIGVLTGPWAAESWCLSNVYLPLSSSFSYCIIISRF